MMLCDLPASYTTVSYTQGKSIGAEGYVGGQSARSQGATVEAEDLNIKEEEDDELGDKWEEGDVDPDNFPLKMDETKLDTVSTGKGRTLSPIKAGRQD